MMVQFSNDDLATVVFSIKNKWKEKAFSADNSTEKEHVCRNKVNHHQEMALQHIAMACILVDVA